MVNFFTFCSVFRMGRTRADLEIMERARANKGEAETYESW